MNSRFVSPYSLLLACLLSTNALLLQGCTINAVLPQEAFTPEPGAPAGYLVGSIGVQTEGEYVSRNDFSYIDYRQIGSEDGATLRFAQGMFRTEPDYETEQTKGVVFALPLTPGEYELYRIRFYYNNGSVEKTHVSDEFSIPFEIRPDEVLYLGELLSYGAWGKNIFGIAVADGGFFVLRDQRTRDLPLIESRHSEVAGPPMRAADFAAYAPPLIFSGEAFDAETVADGTAGDPP
ncbi:MAG: hypothetical protein AAF184_10440 [Pseudomonadota bacterium]